MTEEKLEKVRVLVNNLRALADEMEDLFDVLEDEVGPAEGEA